ncbi:YrzI family small protein (plasmid) [Bacillus sp. 31A1R]|uniref:YrzI family small protein n=1 Tax=Robertmurraya mangrovi TaxID=3098077 RepID=A0ABU5IUR5_9BACI|nr:YrzI family small protein [Bacillus sp. 31A1R]MDZ5470898.1 YrzI family small protein [Bacillus sp. 31A1R]
MTLNILFFSVSINKRKITGEDALRQEKARKVYSDNKAQQVVIHRMI